MNCSGLLTRIRFAGVEGMYAPLMLADQKSRRRHAFHPGSLREAWVAVTGVREGAAIPSTRGRMADGSRASSNMW
jgi:hypothetical protein